VKSSKKLGGQAGVNQKSGRRHGSPRHRVRTATVALSLLCDVHYSTVEKLSWEFLIYYYIT